MGQDDVALTGFSWRGGIERDTTGILMWSKPYIVTLPDTQEQVCMYIVVYYVCVCVTFVLWNVCTGKDIETPCSMRSPLN